MFPNLDNLKVQRIRDKLRRGMAPNQIALWFASNTIARELKAYTDGTLEDFVKELQTGLILKTHEQSDIIIDFLNQEQQRGIDKLCVYLEGKDPDDIQAFLEILQEKRSLASLANFLQSAVVRCEGIPMEADDNHNQSEIEVPLRLHVPDQYENFVVKTVEANKGQFNDGVLHVDARITLVKKQSILMVLMVQDEWDLENIQYNITSGVFYDRFVNWLNNKGLKLTSGEIKAMSVGIMDKTGDKMDAEPTASSRHQEQQHTESYRDSAQSPQSISPSHRPCQGLLISHPPPSQESSSMAMSNNPRKELTAVSSSEQHVRPLEDYLGAESSLTSIKEKRERHCMIM